MKTTPKQYEKLATEAFKHLKAVSDKGPSRIAWMSFCGFVYRVVREMATSPTHSSLPSVHIKDEKLIGVWTRPEGRFVIMWPKDISHKVQSYDEATKMKRTSDRHKLGSLVVEWLKAPAACSGSTGTHLRSPDLSDVS